MLSPCVSLVVSPKGFEYVWMFPGLHSRIPGNGNRLRCRICLSFGHLGKSIRAGAVNVEYMCVFVVLPHLGQCVDVSRMDRVGHGKGRRFGAPHLPVIFDG